MATRQIKVGKFKIGGNAPVVIQSMTKTDTRDVFRTVRQIRELEKTGCEIIRVAIKDTHSARSIRRIKNSISIPIVADIHFDYKLALASIDNGADKIRLNPGNIYKEKDIISVIKAAKANRIPVRIGINSGSIKVERGMQPMGHKKMSDAMVKEALGYIKTFEKKGFYDIIVSLKASDVMTTIDAYRKFSKKSEYPLHLGVTAAGPVLSGLVKSSIGIGILLSEGIGDTIRVSLTGDPREEVVAAKNILQALGLRRFGCEIISCPTCGRCQIDLQRIVKEAENKISRVEFKDLNLKIAIMGCEVNGPGEAKDADIGIACGKKSGALFKKGKILKTLPEKDLVKTLLKEIYKSIKG